MALPITVTAAPTKFSISISMYLKFYTRIYYLQVTIIGQWSVKTKILLSYNFYRNIQIIPRKFLNELNSKLGV